MSWRGKKVLVTGGGGFIGSWLVERLVREGADVAATVQYNSRGDHGRLSQSPADIRDEIEILSGDIRDRFWVRRAVEGREIVFHLAALIAIPYSYQAPQSYVDVNVQGTLNILEACRDCRVERLVHTSTSEVYGTAQYTPIDETHPLHPQSPYAATKSSADQLVYSYYAAFDVPVTTIRPFNNYGPRQSARAVIPTIISQAVSGDDVQLGSLDPVRDFLFVQDTVSGFMAAALAPKVLGETINLGTGVGVTIGEVVDRVATIVGRPLNVIADKQRVRPTKSEVFELICGAEKAKRLLNWIPETSLEAGLAATVEWIGSHKELYRPKQYAV